MKPYKQTSSQSCLSVCLLTCINQDITVDKERELLYEGLKTTDPDSVSVTRAFVKKYGESVTVYVDNNYYRTELHEEHGAMWLREQKSCKYDFYPFDTISYVN